MMMMLVSFDCWLCACVLDCVSYLCAIDGVSIIVGWQVSVCRMTSVQLAKACLVVLHKWSVDCIRSSSVVECLSYTDVPLVPAWLRLSVLRPNCCRYVQCFGWLDVTSALSNASWQHLHRFAWWGLWLTEVVSRELVQTRSL